MTRKRQQGLISWGRIVAVVVVTIALFLAADFGRRAIDAYRLGRAVAALEEEVAAMKTDNKALKERLEYVSTDAYIEEAAREKLRWVEPGDTAVILLSREDKEAPVTTPVPSHGILQGQGVIEKPNWQRWLDLFFGP
ncbi:MAG: septum formation initiator family protein [Dehalococcoidia bacterium]